MQLYEIELTFHDNLFYETRTLGRLYETGRLLHNIALSYALGFAETSYHHALDEPRYHEELAVLNDKGIYVTPAKDLAIQFEVNTFKYGEEQNAVLMERSNKNIPTYGRAKEIAVGSQFRLGILSESELDFPKWIRMGIWMSKALVESHEIPVTQIGAGAYTVSRYPLNPRDLPQHSQLQVFDLFSMRPNSLVENALIEAPAWWQGIDPHTNRRFYLPVGMLHNV